MERNSEFKEILTFYNEEIKSIMHDSDNIAALLVGSSKNVDFKNEKNNITDIDIFVISTQKENQIRDIKILNGVEFDINKFSINYVKTLLDKKEYFFIKEMKDAKIIYDKNNISKNIMKISKIKYDEGPKKISESEMIVLANTIYDNISRLENKNSFENYEYEFLTNTYLKDIIKGYFIKNRKWIPKDKKIFKYLSENEKDLFKLVINVYEDYEYNKLKKVYEYVFSKQ